MIKKVIIFCLSMLVAQNNSMAPQNRNSPNPEIKKVTFAAPGSRKDGRPVLTRRPSCYDHSTSSKALKKGNASLEKGMISRKRQVISAEKTAVLVSPY